MIELLLAADELLAAGDLDHAERIFRQVADADPRNAIAVVGLARVAEARGRLEEAHELVTRALALDPEDVTALRLLASAIAAPAALAEDLAAEAAPGEPAEPSVADEPTDRPVAITDEAPRATRLSVLDRIRAFFRPSGSR